MKKIILKLGLSAMDKLAYYNELALMHVDEKNYLYQHLNWWSVVSTNGINKYRSVLFMNCFALCSCRYK